MIDAPGLDSQTWENKNLNQLVVLCEGGCATEVEESAVVPGSERSHNA
jgi:hypothetical protein